MTLQYNGEEQIPADATTVWEFVNDPAQIARCLPDLLTVTIHDPKHFDAVVNSSEVGVAKPDAQPVKLTARKERLATKEQILEGLKAADKPQLVDARSADEFCGIATHHTTYLILTVAEIEAGLDHMAEAIDHARVADLAQVGTEHRRS